MILKRWQILAGVVMLIAAVAASAMSLGRVRGTALVGRGLDLSVQAGMEAQEATPDANCFAAEVFYGDSRVSPNAVSVAPERTSNGEMRIRIRASQVVDEPVVTLFLRVSCAAAVSRRYVLLAEVLSDAELGSAQPFPAASAPTSSAVSPLASPRIAFGGALASAASSAAADDSAAQRRAERSAQRQARKVARDAQRKNQAQAPGSSADAAPVRVAAPEASSSRISVMRKSAMPSSPRLKLDLLDLTIGDPSLRGSAELASAPSGDEAVRRQAQALWRTLNAAPEDALRDAQRLETFETQMRAAQDQNKRQGQDIATLSTELVAAQKARYLNPFTIGLGLLALVGLALSLLLWRSSKGMGSGQPWWRSGAAKAEQKDEQHLWKHLGDGSESIVQPLQQSAAAKPVSGFSPNTTSPGMPARLIEPAGSGAPSPLRVSERSIDPIDLKQPVQKLNLATAKTQPLGSPSGSGRGGMGQVDNTPPPAFVASAPAPRGGRNGFGNTDFASSSFGGMGANRVVAAEELFDIQEQADFFLSLGQPEQAIEVLKNHITENVETSALAYMDLFDIYHRTGREADYKELREEFNRVFNAQVPEFGKYGAPSNGLEDVPSVLLSIQESWSKPQQAQDVIEESIFRQPGADQHPLDMAAYRELMLLYALAKELGRPGAKFSMLPSSMQSAALPIAGVSNAPDVDLGGGLVLSNQQEEMLSFAAATDATINLPNGLPPTRERAQEDGLDFDLSDSAELKAYKLPGAAKKS